MSLKDIRLRLLIRRHAVPEVKLVWPCTASEDLTVAKLLTQVNEVIPLESGEWGLEDYAVELADGNGGSFECLHYQPVGKLFKDDDQVIIRSLLTEDLKRRRLSGRHQISTDGKHLIDGLAFGRPWLRVPRDRPALELPPRKRARITYDDDEDDEDEDEEYQEDVYDDEDDDEDYRPEQLLLEGPEVVETDDSSLGLRVPFHDADLDDEFEDEDIEDGDVDHDDEEEAELDPEEATEPLFDPEEEEDEDSELEEVVERLLEPEEEEEDISDDEAEEDALALAEELRLLQADNAVVGDDTEEPMALSAPSFLDIGLTSLDDITALRAAFPLSSVANLQNELISNDRQLRRTYDSLAKSNDPAMSFDEMMDKVLCGFPEFSQLLEQEDPTFNGFESQESAESGFKGFSSKRVLIEEVESFDIPATEADEDEETAPADLSQSMEEVIPDSAESSSSESSSEAESSSDSESEESDNDSSDSSSDDDEEQADGIDDPTLSSGARPYLPIEEVDESSSDSSDSDSDSDSSEDGGVVMKDAAKESSEDSSDDSSSSSDSDSDSESEPEEVSSKPRPQAKVTSPPAPNPPKPQPAPAAVKEVVPNPPGTGLTKTQKRNARRREMKRLKQLEVEGSQAPTASEVSAEESELLARKQALLDTFMDEAPKPVEKQQTKATEAQSEPPVEEKAHDPTPATADSGPRRLKVDMGAGRRLLLGALGLKNPKSKADEDKLRKDLMKDVRPLKNARIEEVTEVADTTMEEPEDPDAWKKNISYRAVECCHEGMVLSEPPFPFVQRWDPQQQFGAMKKRKRDSQNFQDDSYYDESYYDESAQWNEDQGETTSKKSKKRKSKGRFEEERPDSQDQDEEVVELNYDDVPPKRPGSSQFTDIDDLPSLPSDVSTLPLVAIDDVKPGMVITWKQLLMSKATNWQPLVSSLTGIVLSLNDDKCVDFLLAKRDREADDREYDAYTGKRVYDKFETPADDEDGEEDDGRRELSWSEMMEPRLVQEAPPGFESQSISSKIGSGVTENHKVSDKQDKQDRDEHVAEELDTQKVRAEVEADLREMAEEEANDNTTIRPPTEQDLSILDNDPADMMSAGTDSRINSPSRQLVETSFAGFSERSSPQVDKSNDHNEKPGESMAVDSEIILDGAEPESIVPDSMSHLDIPSQQPRAQLTPVVDDSALVPSSVSSIHSGRQPLSNYELEESHNAEEDSDEHTTPRPREITPTQQKPKDSTPPLSSSPFPSVGEVWHTANTSRLTQSPRKSTQQSVIRSLDLHGKQDTDYEAAMRKLDDGEDSDQSVIRRPSRRSLFPNATQPDPMELPKLRSPKMEKQTKVVKTEKFVKKERPVRKSSSFIIPKGSQVITLSSSPISAPGEEDYAEDSVDETYHDDSLPKGAGWVPKNVPPRETRSRGKSVPATTKAPTGLRPVPEPMASAFSQIKGRKKYSRKF